MENLIHHNCLLLFEFSTAWPGIFVLWPWRLFLDGLCGFTGLSKPVCHALLREGGDASACLLPSKCRQLDHLFETSEAAPSSEPPERTTKTDSTFRQSCFAFSLIQTSDLQYDTDPTDVGVINTYVGVFDGHGLSFWPLSTLKDVWQAVQRCLRRSKQISENKWMNTGKSFLQKMLFQSHM